MLYNLAKAKILRGEIDFESADIRVLLLDETAGAGNPDHTTVAAVIGTDELAGTGYVRKSLASLTVTQDDTNNRAVFDAADVTWAGLNADNGEIGMYLIYLHVTNDSDSVPIQLGDPTNVTANGEDCHLRFGAEGIFYI